MPAVYARDSAPAKERAALRQSRELRPCFLENQNVRVDILSERQEIAAWKRPQRRLDAVLDPFFVVARLERGRHPRAIDLAGGAVGVSRVEGEPQGARGLSCDGQSVISNRGLRLGACGRTALAIEPADAVSARRTSPGRPRYWPGSGRRPSTSGTGRHSPRRTSRSRPSTSRRTLWSLCQN